jgi:glutamyl-tRNA synthetase
MTVKTRFAPSPTGWLHIGGARTALFSWLYARHLGGKFVLRIEDTDLQRSKKEYEEEIMQSMTWLGLEWDELAHQSKRFDVYRAEAQRLVKEGKAYEKDGAVFMPCAFDTLVVDDMIRGEVVFTELPKEEEVLIKSDGSPTYSFACVVDDAQMNITHVVRGQDHLPNTPKQLLMYKALGYQSPRFAHLPMILAQEGGKMSKRHGATAVIEYRKLGFVREAILNYLMLLGWSPGEKELISLDEAVKLFDLKDINKSNAKFDMDKLDWINASYLKAMPAADLMPFVTEGIKANGFTPDAETVETLIAMYRERATHATDFADASRWFFDCDFAYDESVAGVLAKPMKAEFAALEKELGALCVFGKDEIKAAFEKAAATLGVKPTSLFLPMRTALTGIKGGPDLFDIAALLGKDAVVARMRRLTARWETIA